MWASTLGDAVVIAANLEPVKKYAAFQDWDVFVCVCGGGGGGEWVGEGGGEGGGGDNRKKEGQPRSREKTFELNAKNIRLCQLPEARNKRRTVQRQNSNYLNSFGSFTWNCLRRASDHKGQRLQVLVYSVSEHRPI